MAEGRYLVVGARGGLGRAVVDRLVAEGRSVIGTVRDAAQARALHDEVPQLAEVIALDLADGDAVLDSLTARFADEALAGVVVCAAECKYGPLETSPLETARRLIEVNAISCLAIYTACMPALRRTGGALVLVSSNSGVVSLPFVGQYQASKFALEAYADVMRMEASKWGVRVVLVEPGGMDTPMQAAMTRGIIADTDAMPAERDALYGDLYRGFRAMVETGSEGNTPLPAVAEVIVAALDDPDPDPRYPVGEDTKFLVAKRKELDDRQLDRFALSIFGIAR